MRVLAFSRKIRKGDLDDDYTLYENGEVLHEYDQNTYLSGLNLKKTLTIDELNEDIKQRLLEAASDSDKEHVRQILGLH